MVDITLDWQTKEYDLGVDKVKVKLRPLKRWAMLKLVPFLKERKGSEGSEIVFVIDDTYKIQEIAEDIFKEHIGGIENLTIDQKPIEDYTVLAKEAVFSSLCALIITDLMKMSSLDREEELNLKEPVTS